MNAQRPNIVGCGALLLGLCACPSTSVDDLDDDDGPIPVAFRAGTRLEPRGWLLDGASVYAETFDTELGVPCRYAKARDGLLRCVPAPADFQSGLAEVFTDASCTPEGRMYLVFDEALLECGRPGAVGRLIGESGVCADERWAVDRLEAAPPPAMMYWGMNGECRLANAMPDGVFLKATELPMEDLVGGTTFTVVEADGIGSVVIRGDDGSSVVMGPADRRYEAVHVATLDQPAGTWLAPSVVATPSGIFEPGCGASLVYSTEACLAVRVQGIVDERSLFKVGDVLGRDDIDAGACGEPPASVYDDYTFFSRGEPMTDADLAAVQETVVGTGPIRARFATTVGGRTLPRAADELLAEGEVCVPRHDASGAFFCVPSAAYQVADERFFSDAACTQPAISDVENTAGIQAGDVGYALGRDECGRPGAVTGTFRVGAQLTDFVYFGGENGCEAMDLSQIPEERWYTLESSTLPALTYGAMR